MTQTFKAYLSLAKPGIVMGNGIALIGGFFLGSPQKFDWQLLLFTLLGLSFVIASAGAINNVFDRDIDRLMERTRNRPLAAGSMSIQGAYIFAASTGLVGFTILAVATNWYTLASAALGFVVYVFLYTMWLKRHSIHGTLVGSLSGAMPPLVGYTAATGSFDVTALLLVLVFGFWQMPHSYAIGIFRSSDFQNAHIPLLPLLRSALHTKWAMTLHGLAFLLSCIAIAIWSPTGALYAIFAIASAATWVGVIAQGFVAQDNVRWARHVFLGSLVVVLMLSFAFTIDRI